MRLPLTCNDILTYDRQGDFGRNFSDDCFQGCTCKSGYALSAANNCVQYRVCAEQAAHRHLSPLVISGVQARYMDIDCEHIRPVNVYKLCKYDYELKMLCNNFQDMRSFGLDGQPAANGYTPEEYYLLGPNFKSGNVVKVNLVNKYQGVKPAKFSKQYPKSKQYKYFYPNAKTLGYYQPSQYYGPHFKPNLYYRPEKGYPKPNPYYQPNKVYPKPKPNLYYQPNKVYQKPKPNFYYQPNKLYPKPRPKPYYYKPPPMEPLDRPSKPWKFHYQPNMQKPLPLHKLIKVLDPNSTESSTQPTATTTPAGTPATRAKLSEPATKSKRHQLSNL